MPIVSLTTGTDIANFASDIQVGGNILLSGPNGCALQLKTAGATIATTANNTASATSLIPAACILLGVTLNVTTLVTADAGTSFTVGDGTTADLFGSGILLAAGTKTTYAAHKSTFAPKLYITAANVTLTQASSGNFTAGAVHVVVFYLNIVALGS